MNVTDLITREYERKDTWWSGKNKPNSNPIQSQSNPIKANKMPKQTQFKPKTNPICSELACPACPERSRREPVEGVEPISEENNAAAGVFKRVGPNASAAIGGF